MKKNGFTLIELLVVISIISLLSSIVLSTVNTARTKGVIAAGQRFARHSEAALGDKLLAKWTFNESSGSAIDEWGGIPMTIGAATRNSSTPNSRGSSLYCNNTGMATVVASQTNDNLSPNGNAVTIMGWFKFTNTPTSGYILAQRWDYANNPNGWSLEINGSGQLAFYANTNYGGPGLTITSTVFKPDTWTHVAASYGNGTIKIYVNGALIGSVTGSSVTMNSYTQTTPLSICNRGGMANSPATYYVDDIEYFAASL